MNNDKIDIFNRPPAISEDTLQYTLYPPQDLSSKASATTLAAVMQSYTESILPDMQWHRDAFQLKVVANPDGDWMLEGRMRVGDCVDDEWCAVWLLREISAKWDVVISACDTDGEFLLIEAAEELPPWVTPTNAENRVWIYGSHLHLIPPSYVSAPSSKPKRKVYPGTRDSDDEGDIDEDREDDYISAEDAIKLVRSSPSDSQAPHKVEKVVWNRVSGYPAAARAHIHYTKAHLPADVAKALVANPSLVQKAVEAFYTRDALQLRATHRMSRFPPEPSVQSTVKMTRTAYAQLVGQKFHSPKIFGRWSEPEGSAEWRRKDVGMKIACGFEMLYQESKNRMSTFDSASTKASADGRKEALRRNADYVKYIENLVNTGYFRGETQGSQLWNELEDKAALAFVDVRRDDDATRPSFASEVNSAISKLGELPQFPDGPEDPDDWLNVDAENFDAILEKATGQKNREEESDSMEVDKESRTETEEDKVAREQASKLQRLAKKVEEFVEGEGGIEGAQFSDEAFSEEELSDTESEASHEEGNVGRSDVRGQSARQVAMEKLVPGIEPSEYGRMPPSFYKNSQRVSRDPKEIEDTQGNGDKDGITSTSQPRRPIMRPPLLPRDEYEGVDSDDESDEEDVDEEEEEEKPQLVGDVEIDMDDEQDEFLEFARQALGVSDDQWRDIVEDRKSRGAFVPNHITVETQPKPLKEASATKSPNDGSQKLRQPVPGPRPNANPNLDSFEAVMQAMDAELARNRSERQNKAAHKVDKGKGKASATESPEDLEDIETAIEAELKAALDQGSDEEDGVFGDSEQLDYNLIKNFLESFKSQAGLSGPVSNLAGRLQPGMKLPRDV